MKNSSIIRFLVIQLLISYFGQITHAVINGWSLKEEDYPFIVRLWDKKHNKACTGTIVGPHVILTAAHCYEAPTGPFIFLERNGKIEKPEVFKNKKYSYKIDAPKVDASKMHADMAILYFPKINFSSSERIEIADEVVDIGETHIFAGFGVYNSDGSTNELHGGSAGIDRIRKNYFNLVGNSYSARGDSGGIVFSRDLHKISGLLSRTGPQPPFKMDVVNLLSSESLDFLFDLSNTKKINICGINLKCR